ncbi:MAG TPA: transcriptional regulator [Patescibacteria group bacterium]|nr:transcriptional regulator [Patescibacteria group bacterium]
MIEQLFGSKTRVKLLQLFYGNPNRSFYVREITRKIDEQINSVRRELANLLSIGIIASDTNNNRLYYEVNQSYEYYEPLSTIFGGGKPETATKKGGKKAEPAAEDPQTLSLKALGNVELALYTGQFTRDESSGVDLLIVGDINQTKLGKFIADLEAAEGKDIRYTVMPLSEYRYRDQVKDRFLSNVLAAKKQILIDKHGLLGSATTDKD